MICLLEKRVHQQWLGRPTHGAVGKFVWFDRKVNMVLAGSRRRKMMREELRPDGAG